MSAINGTNKPRHSYERRLARFPRVFCESKIQRNGLKGRDGRGLLTKKHLTSTPEIPRSLILLSPFADYIRALKVAKR